MCGFEVTKENVVTLLRKMAIPTTCNGNDVLCTLPITRSDVLHACDIAEDVCIAYGFNNVVDRLPPSMTIGGEQRLNKMTDLVREELAHAGYNEALNFALTSTDDVTVKLNRPDKSQLVTIANPKTLEF